MALGQNAMADVDARTRVIALLALALASSLAPVACHRPGSDSAPSILLYVGAGASPNDVSALKHVLDENHLSYATATAAQLNAMDSAQFKAYRLLIMPGGDFLAMGNGLTPETTARVRNAVFGGLHYLGVCAGGFLAGTGRYNSFGLAPVQFPFYSIADRGVRKAVVPISTPDSSPMDQYWEDGPQFTGWGAIVAKYPDSTAAIVEGSAGSGWVMLTGIHPEAPDSWRTGMHFTSPASIANAYAGRLIRAALERTELPHY